MIELLAVHRPHERDVVDTRAQMRQQIRQLHPALAVAAKRSRTAHQLGALLLDERKLDLIQNRLGHRLAVEFVQFRLLIEEVHLTWTTFHKEVDAPLRCRCKLRQLRRDLIRKSAVFIQQRSQRQRTQTAGPRRKEPPPVLRRDVGFVLALEIGGHVHRVSSLQRLMAESIS